MIYVENQNKNGNNNRYILIPYTNNYGTTIASYVDYNNNEIIQVFNDYKNR
ncbi:hypothetical protein BCR36DRAFT_161117 [Piromyces finnis]|uniref:Uncharacterized protein n=1 Tax=Piromyces finnis TaxID=1754191 RepID=A0A1Y1UY95_9FUNG|nr:hypothetical protein BCR36DRAFT_161117 [Piromyces finnis]|eukprot:ORX42232.1 hypothetical protein BCR36DRAFT_161117 [Piromyces finnis]